MTLAWKMRSGLLTTEIRVRSKIVLYLYLLYFCSKNMMSQCIYYPLITLKTTSFQHQLWTSRHETHLQIRPKDLTYPHVQRKNPPLWPGNTYSTPLPPLSATTLNKQHHSNNHICQIKLPDNSNHRNNERHCPRCPHYLIPSPFLWKIPIIE